MPSLKLILILFLLTACTPKKYEVNWLNPMAQHERFEFGREIASGEECYVDSFDNARVKREITALEKRFSKKIQFDHRFKHLEANPAESEYLAKAGHEQIVLIQGMENCKDLHCLLGLPFNNNADEAANRLYHWFLMMGTVISTKEVTPLYNYANVKYLDMQFTLEELRAMTLVARMLPEAYRNLHIQGIYRVPDGFPISKEHEDNSGLFIYEFYNPSSSNKWNYLKNPGLLYLTKLETDISEDKHFYGSFYHALIHELGHALDYTVSGNGKYLMYSLSPTWYNLSWKRVEGIIDGKTFYKDEWDASKGDEFYSYRYNNKSYSKKNPKEDFADATAFSTWQPDAYKKVAPTKYKFIIDKFHNGEGHDVESLRKQYYHKFKISLSEQWTSSVSKCSLPTGDLAEDCVENAIQYFINKFIAFIKLNDYYGCGFWQSEPGLRIQMAEYARAFIKSQNSRMLATGESATQQFNRSKISTVEKLLKECDPRAIFFENFNLKNPESKYQSMLNSCVSKYKNKENSEIVQIAYEEIKLKYTFSYIKEQVTLDIQERMAGLPSKIKKDAKQLLDSCYAQENSEKLLLNPFHAGVTYVDKNILACINTRINKRLDNLMRDELGTSYQHAGKAMAYIEGVYLPIYLRSLSETINEVATTELQWLADVQLAQDEELIEQYYHRYSEMSLEANSFYQFCLEDINADLVAELKERLRPRGQAITINYEAIATAAAQEYCSQFKTKKLSEQALEQVEIDNKIDEMLNASNVTFSKDWFNTIQNDSMWKIVCEQKLKYNTQKMVGSTFTKEYRYYNKEQLTHLSLEKICQQLKPEFDKIVEQFNSKLEAIDLPRKFEDSLKNTYSWLFKNTENEVIQGCNEGIQNSLFGQSIFADVINLHNKMKAKVVALQICRIGKMAWQDVQNALKKVNPDCTSNCWGFLQSAVASYYIELPKEFWAEMDVKKDERLLNELVVRFDQHLQKSINECLTKHNTKVVVYRDYRRVNCLNTTVFYPQNFSKILATIYPSGRKINPQHIQKLDEYFESRKAQIPQMIRVNINSSN